MNSSGPALTTDAVAYHEAGHAVVALAIGVDVVAAVLLRDPNGGEPGGGVTPCSKERGRNRAREDESIALAGPVAEARYHQLQFGGDFKHWLCRSLTGNTDGDMHKLAGQGALDADQIEFVDGVLCDQWQQVARLAQSLLQKSKLSGAEIRSLLP